MPLEARARAGGFSLLEVLIAATIMALALGALYTASARATRTAAHLQRHTWAVETAQSLLASHRHIPPGGLHLHNANATFQWRIESTPLASATAAKRWPLWRITVTVSWREAGKLQNIALQSIRPQAPA